jgi:transcriptional regulator with XRE-family HTH domain
MSTFGERLRRLRAGRSQKEIAESLGMPQTTLSTLENQQAVPRGDVLNRLAEFFGVAVTYFYDVPATPPSDAAKNWLQQLKQDVKGHETVAFHSSVQVSSDIKETIAKKLREKHEETNRS